ncbi:MAG: dephospho-CoA kinase [Bacteroidetes bacterium]|nr:dephospho-CoA kinase [Bacteroidota bacterium]
MKTIGITGGIGSGKSTVSRALAALGYPVFISDEESKQLLDKDSQLRAALKAAFGQDLYTPGNKLDKARLAAIIFGNAEALQQVNALVHPAVFRAFHAWQAQQAAAGHQLAFKEAAILYEAGAAAELDAVIVVSCPEEERIRRVTARDGISREAVLARMAHQWPEAQKVALADYVLINDGQQPVLPQLQHILQQLLKGA